MVSVIQSCVEFLWLRFQDIAFNSPDAAPTISCAPLDSPHAAIEEVLFVIKPLSEVTASELVTKSHLKVAKAATKAQSEAIACQVETANGEAAPDSHAGESGTESDREMEEGDKAKDKMSARRDDRAMDGDLAQQEHDKLKKLIACHQKLLQSKQKLFSDAKAASTMFDLECLSWYNELWLNLHLWLNQQCETITNAKLRHHVMLKARMKSIQPATHALQWVTQLAAKSDGFACCLCLMACYLQWTGELPENNQGKGTTHATHLDNPDIVSAVRNWVIGLVPVDEGGFEGHICVSQAPLSLSLDLSYYYPDVSMQIMPICQ